MENGSLVEFIDSVFEQFFRASLTEDIAGQEHLLFYLRALNFDGDGHFCTPTQLRCISKKPLPEFLLYILNDVAKCRTNNIFKKGTL